MSRISFENGFSLLEAMILVAFLGIVAAMVFGDRPAEKFRDACTQAGGIPVIGRYDNVCYAPGTVIPIKR